MAKPTRDRVLDAVRDGWAEHPWRHSTIRELARRAGVTHSTVAHHLTRLAKDGELDLMPDDHGRRWIPWLPQEAA